VDAVTRVVDALSAATEKVENAEKGSVSLSASGMMPPAGKPNVQIE